MVLYLETWQSEVGTIDAMMHWAKRKRAASLVPLSLSFSWTSSDTSKKHAVKKLVNKTETERTLPFGRLICEKAVALWLHRP